MARNRKNIYRNIKLTISYCGTRYHGWQKQPGLLTLQEVLEKAVSTITGETTSLIASGRTDAGVHAMGQVVNFKTESTIPLSGLIKGLNSMLPPDISVLDARDVPWKFHAIGSSILKKYCYLMISSTVKLPLWEKRAWVITRGELDSDSMNLAAGMLMGSHDFSSFTASGTSAKTRIRNVVECSVKQVDYPLFPPATGKHLMFTIAANGFLRYMVRNIAGLLAEIGSGRKDYRVMEQVVAARDRSAAGPTAPPQGLYLMHVIYDEAAENGPLNFYLN